MALKIPPPPPIANADPGFNRWLVEVTSILAAGGGVDPTQIPGYTDLQTQVATNTTDIATLEHTTGGQGSSILTLQSEIVSVQSEITSINSQLTTLESNAVVRNGTTAPGAGLGVNGDWYADTSAKHIYVKVAGVYVLIV